MAHRLNFFNRVQVGNVNILLCRLLIEQELINFERNSIMAMNIKIIVDDDIFLDQVQQRKF